ncbi:hypothetical protein Tco_0015881 [Tanacetum coccineum]
MSEGGGGCRGLAAEVVAAVAAWYDEDVHFLRSVETKFPAIVYNDALTSEFELSCEHTASPQHIDKVHWKIEISFSDSNDEDYTVIYDNDTFSYKIFNVNHLKLDMGNGIRQLSIPFTFSSLITAYTGFLIRRMTSWSSE